MKFAVALAAVLVATPTLVLAEASTYRGTIGDKDVVVEFSEEPAPGNTDLFGRYFYVDQGVDIPLHAIKAQRSRLGLAEELPCSEEENNCPNALDETPFNAPLGAKWELTVSDDREHLEGTFAINGRKLPIELTIYGARQFDPTGGLITLTDFASSLFYSGEVLTPETSPYDYLKVTIIDMVEGDAIEMQGGTFRFVTDPRTKFQFPRVTDLGGGDTTAINK
jgi:hypothetical protein